MFRRQPQPQLPPRQVRADQALDLAFEGIQTEEELRSGRPDELSDTALREAKELALTLHLIASSATRATIIVSPRRAEGRYWFDTTTVRADESGKTVTERHVVPDMGGCNIPMSEFFPDRTYGHRIQALYNEGNLYLRVGPDGTPDEYGVLYDLPEDS